ncbi:MAG: cell division protein ZapA [Magnetococcales bacterium]|nr:cell division protein ZapA [Magnetococcales bacterium]
MADSIDVTIHGQLFRLRVEANSAYVRELAGYVDGVMGKMARQSRNQSTDRLAIMAALRITDSLFQVKEQVQMQVQQQVPGRVEASSMQDGQMEQVNQRIQRLVAASEQVLRELEG